MRKILLSCMFTAGILSGATYVIDTDATTLNWKGSKLANASSHNGVVKVSDGSIEINKNEPKAGKISINLKSIENQDVPIDKGRDKLEGHLKSEDFFNVNKPGNDLAVFTIKSFTKKAKGSYLAKGDLKLNGVTKPLEVPMTTSIGSKKATANGEITIDRTKWNVTYHAKSFWEKAKDYALDKVIGNDIELKFDIVAMAKKPLVAPKPKSTKKSI